MSFALLEKQVQSLPQELQANIEMYALFVINQFKKTSAKKSKKRTATEILNSLSGIIPSSENISIKDIREERLQKRYEL
ncbi:MAG: hypothetical protein K6C98_04795 [Treponema sp.]|nr:hypothetical protein [Treponema sp.]